MLNKIKEIGFINRKPMWIGWFVTVHLILSLMVLLLLIGIGINPTLLVSVIGAPLWIAVAFTSKMITDKIMED